MQRYLNRIIYILCGLCAFALGMKQLREPDIWWQLLSGRWMLEYGQVTKTDMFSYTMSGQPWVNVKWLYEVIIGTFEKALGPEGVLLLQALVNVAIVYLLVRTIQYAGKQFHKQIPVFATAIFILLFLAICEYRMAGRPEMMSHLLCAVYLFLLWRSPSFEFKKIWWLVPLQCLWANMHEGYPVGIVIAGTAVGGTVISYFLTREKEYLQQAIRALAIFATCILIILLNPNTIQLWKQPFEIYRQIWANKYTTELYSYKDAAYWTMQAKWHWLLTGFTFLYWIGIVWTAIKEKKSKTFFTPVTTTYLLILLLFSYLALTANRNIPFAQIALVPSLALLGGWIAVSGKVQAMGIYQALSKRAGYIAIAIAAIFYLSIVSDKWYKYTASPNKFGIHTSMLHNPTGASAFIKQHGIQGPAFSDYFVSSYLLWDLYPAFKSYIDLRDLDVFPVAFFYDYFSMYNQPEKFDTLDKKYNFNYVVLSTSQLSALQIKLYWGHGYNMVYLDPVCTIFLKQNDQNKPINSNLALQKLFTWPQPAEDPAWATVLNKLLNPTLEYPDEDETNQAIYAALFYNQVRNYDISLKLLKQYMPSMEDNPRAYVTLANTYMQFASVLPDAQKQGKLDSANFYLEQAKEIDADFAPLYLALGNLYFVRGNFEGAAENLDNFVKRDKSNAYAYFLLGLSNRSMWLHNNNKTYASRVVKDMTAAVRLNPQNGKAYLYMAEAELALGDRDAARKNIQELAASGTPLTADEQKLLDRIKQQSGI